MAVDPGEFFSGYDYNPSIAERDNNIDDEQTELAIKLRETFTAIPKSKRITVKLDKYLDRILDAATEHIPRPLVATNIVATSSPVCGVYEVEPFPELPTIEGIKRGEFDYDVPDLKSTMDWGIVMVEYSPSLGDLEKNKKACRSELYLLNVALYGRNVLVNHNTSKHGLLIVPGHNETILFKVEEGPSGENEEYDKDDEPVRFPTRYEETVGIPGYHLRILGGVEREGLMELFKNGIEALKPEPKKPTARKTAPKPQPKTSGLPSRQFRQ
jgi:hypothetical protein